MRSRLISLMIWLFISYSVTATAETSITLCSAPGHPLNESIFERLDEAYQKLNISISLKIYPSERCILMANIVKSDIDGILIIGEDAIKKETSPHLTKVPVVLAQGEIVVFTTDVQFSVNGWQSLRPYKIGMLIGFREGFAKTAGMTVEKVPTLEQLFKKLILGRNDIVVLPRGLGLLGIKSITKDPVFEAKVKKIRILEPPLQRDKIYHFLNKKHHYLIPKLTAILKQKKIVIPKP